MWLRFPGSSGDRGDEFGQALLIIAKDSSNVAINHVEASGGLRRDAYRDAHRGSLCLKLFLFGLGFPPIVGDDRASGVQTLRHQFHVELMDRIHTDGSTRQNVIVDLDVDDGYVFRSQQSHGGTACFRKDRLLGNRRSDTTSRVEQRAKAINQRKGLSLGTRIFRLTLRESQSIRDLLSLEFSFTQVPFGVLPTEFQADSTRLNAG